MFCSSTCRGYEVPIVGHCVEVFFRVATYYVHIVGSDKKITMEKVRIQ